MDLIHSEAVSLYRYGYSGADRLDSRQPIFVLELVDRYF